MAKYTKIKLTKKKPSSQFKFITNSMTDYEKLIKLRDEGYHITVIKNIEHSVNEYIRLKHNGLTIESIEQFDNDIHVTVVRSADYHTIILPKSLFKSTKQTYEFSIGCSDLNPEIVELDCSKRVKSHKSKSDVIYIGE